MIEISNNWQDFLANQAIDQGPVPPGAGFFSVLGNFGLIAISGDEAANFLHNQLTNDITGLTGDSARLAGYCSPKGRLLATMLAWRGDEEIFLMLPKELLAAIQKRLQMFVLRAKVKLRDASADYALIGLAGLPAAKLDGHLPAIPDNAYAVRASDRGLLIRMPDTAGGMRALWIAQPADAIAAWLALAENLRPAPAAAWNLSEIQAGTPWISLPTQEKFVPQMINFELIGGVNFKKGCYPGQEIVARSQYLGKLKRRMLPARLQDAEVRAGMEVFSEADPEQPCGMIVNAERRFDGEIDCLVEIKLAQAESGAIRLGSATGPQLRFLPLPYPLPDDGQ